MVLPSVSRVSSIPEGWDPLLGPEELVEVVHFGNSFRGFPWELVGWLVSRGTFGHFFASVLAVILCDPFPSAGAGCLTATWKLQCCEAFAVHVPSPDLELQPSTSHCRVFIVAAGGGVTVLLGSGSGCDQVSCAWKNTVQAFCSQRGRSDWSMTTSQGLGAGNPSQEGYFHRINPLA